ncbi:MAG TPA: hypothetical protein PKC14_02625 [Candidatus Absconditabacterales bacterium]|nr:hypothetical protein [Candidatus Absconditabacterales bacterium]
MLSKLAIKLVPKLVAKRVLRGILPELRAYAQALQKFENISNYVLAVVEFFNLRSPWSQRVSELIELSILFKKAGLKKEMRALNAFCESITSSGEHKKVINRSIPGERATIYNIFLGNELGLFTSSVAVWLERREQLEKLFVWHLVNEDQVGRFIKLHVSIQKKAISDLGVSFQKI